MPPPISKINSLKVVPIGTSTSPTFLTLPPRAKTFVPFDFSVPTLANSFPPTLKIYGTFARVSTLFMIVGESHKPLTAGKGGRGLGIPRLPSIEFNNAVSSPHTKAPAPSLICTLNEKPVFKMLSPSKPAFSNSSIAILSLETAIGYSALT